MHYDFVDIGTCDFDLSVNPLNNHNTALLVEPLKYYLDKIPDHPLIVKDNVGISNEPGVGKIYFLPEDIIVNNKLPDYLRGCSSLNALHPTVLSKLQQYKLSEDLIQSTIVNVITFDELCLKHNITSIGKLKIDTEGHEQYILPSVLKKVNEGMIINSIKFENQHLIGNKQFVDSLIPQFESARYKVKSRTPADIIIELAT